MRSTGPFRAGRYIAAALLQITALVALCVFMRWPWWAGALLLLAILYGALTVLGVEKERDR